MIKFLYQLGDNKSAVDHYFTDFDKKKKIPEFEALLSRIH